MADRFRGFLPVVVDIESGGFNAATDALLEIALVLLDVDGEEAPLALGHGGVEEARDRFGAFAGRAPLVSGARSAALAAIALLADQRVQVEPMISARIGLDDFLEKGLRPLIEAPAETIKVLVYP